MKILFGFYYGIGDFISAIPSIRRYVELNEKAKVFVALGEQNKDLLKIIDLTNVEFIFFPLFSFKKIKKIIKFYKKIFLIRFDRIYVSPHCQDQYTSWKIPLMLHTLKIANKNIKVYGAAGDRFSFFYNKKVIFNKNIPLQKREEVFLKLIKVIDKVESNDIFSIKRKKTEKKIIIHPGASRKNKCLQIKKYKILIKKLEKSFPDYNIYFIGLKSELRNFKNIFCSNKKIYFFSDKLCNTIKFVENSEVILTMDSSFSHIATTLNLNHIAIFGPTDPNIYGPYSKKSKIITYKELDCVPCNKMHCMFNEIHCMKKISGEKIFKEIKTILNRGKDD